MADNLESTTYETFENDAIKYELYEQACLAAIKDKQKYGHFKQTQVAKPQGDNDVTMNSNNDEPIVIMYFGAGRGPLIRRALSAAKTAKANVHVVALDKNPNAIVTLRNMIIDEGMEDKVTLIAGDMRHVSVDKL